MPPRDLLESPSGNPVFYTFYFGAQEPDLQVSGSSEVVNSWARQDHVEGTTSGCCAHQGDSKRSGEICAGCATT